MYSPTRQIIMTMLTSRDIRSLLIETATAAAAPVHAQKCMDSVRPNGYGQALDGSCVR
jgi:hypothetical protein